MSVLSCRVLQSVAECCRVLQSVAECCRVLQSVAECCRVLQSAAECCRVLRVAECCRVLQSVAECCRVLQSVAECSRVLQSAAECCRVLQSVAECCRVLQSVMNNCSVSLLFESCHTYKRVTAKRESYGSWPRPVGCLKLHIIFRKNATNYMALLRKMTYKDEASYASLPPCIQSDARPHLQKCRLWRLWGGW